MLHIHPPPSQLCLSDYIKGTLFFYDSTEQIVKANMDLIPGDTALQCYVYCKMITIHQILLRHLTRQVNNLNTSGLSSFLNKWHLWLCVLFFRYSAHNMVCEYRVCMHLQKKVLYPVCPDKHTPTNTQAHKHI